MKTILSEKSALLLISLLISFSAFSQEMTMNEEEMRKANKTLHIPREKYLACAAASQFGDCIKEFVKTATSPYEMNAVANIIYNADPKTSFDLHQKAYNSNKNEVAFALEYAIELHRSGEYKKAIELYEKCLTYMKGNSNIMTWLSDCYINTGEVKKSIECWELANHPKNHTGMEEAIHSIYGRTDQLALRNDRREQVRQGNAKAALDLLYMDFNWEYDWWNKGKIGDSFYKEDIDLIRSATKMDAATKKLCELYIKLKKRDGDHLTQEEQMEAIKKIIEGSDKDKPSEKTTLNKDSLEIYTLLNEKKLIIGKYPIPMHGAITSDILDICFKSKALSESKFLNERGKEIRDAGIKLKDPQLYNIYAYLSVEKADSLRSIDNLGWMVFGDERFALGYLRSVAKTLMPNDPILEKAIKQFPNSSQIYIIKVILMKKEKTETLNEVIELIRRDFKNINSGEGLDALFGIGRSSYALKYHFGSLKELSK